jgi:hypothetical protein
VDVVSAAIAEDLRSICVDLVLDVDMVDAADWSETTEEERYWMEQTRDLATAILVLLEPAS